MRQDDSGIKIAPSILAADYWRLAEQVRDAETSGADRLHIDVMDGHFVPNLSLGPVIVRSLRPHTKLPLQTHLMVAEPESFLESFVEAGTDAFVVHQECGTKQLQRVVQRVKEMGKGIGVAINPDTPVASLDAILPEVDEILVMTVNPGFGGQEFMHRCLKKIEMIRDMVERLGIDCDISVDGGIDANTAPLAVAAGARVLVAGSAVFRNEAGVATAIETLRTRPS